MTHKLYISAVALLSSLGGVAVFVSIILATHDAAEYQALPEAYRHGIEKLQQGCPWLGLNDNEKQAMQDQAKRWAREHELRWWDAYLVDVPARDEVHQASLTLSRFDEVVSRWGLFDA